jgi:hypothetical protein
MTSLLKLSADDQMNITGPLVKTERGTGMFCSHVLSEMSRHSSYSQHEVLFLHEIFCCLHFVCILSFLTVGVLVTRRAV